MLKKVNRGVMSGALPTAMLARWLSSPSSSLLLPGLGITHGGLSVVVRGAATSLAQHATVSTPHFGDAYASAFGLGFGAVGDFSWCTKLSQTSYERKTRVCLVLQPAAYEHGVTVASGIRLTAW